MESLDSIDRLITIKRRRETCDMMQTGHCGNRRLEVLKRQLTAAKTAQECYGTKELDFCPAEMSRWLVHDNYELRQQIFEFLKVEW